MHAIWGTVGGRWYVTLFGLAFLWCAVRQLGWRRTAVYGLIAVSIGALAENGSVHLGFPYTRYTFNPALRGDELFIGDVPLMVPLSYTFMAYFAFSSGRLLASGPWELMWKKPACLRVGSPEPASCCPTERSFARANSAAPPAWKQAVPSGRGESQPGYEKQPEAEKCAISSGRFDQN